MPRVLTTLRRVNPAVVAQDKGHIPALRTLEHTLARTDQYAELAGVLRMQALMFETQRITAVSDSRHGGSAGGF